jgi:uncharacterized membrane protein YdjX (TVP38/TMEM64 family)
MNKNIVQRLVVLALLAGLILGGLAFLPVRDYLTTLLETIQGLGVWGPVLLAGLYIVATVLFVPGSLLTLGAGFAFGVVTGTVAVSVGSTLGASAAFFVGRFLARELIEQKVVRDARFRAIDQAVGAQGFKIVLLTRLSPVFPFNLLNYAYGLTKVRFRDYFLASWIGMFPATVMYVYLGSASRDLTDLAAGNVEGSVAQKVLFALGLVATVIVTVFVTRLARRALDEAAPGDTAKPGISAPETQP